MAFTDACDQTDMDKFYGAGEQWLLFFANGFVLLSDRLPGLAQRNRLVEDHRDEFDRRLFA